jgi:hypothetical protein
MVGEASIHFLVKISMLFSKCPIAAYPRPLTVTSRLGNEAIELSMYASLLSTSLIDEEAPERSDSIDLSLEYRASLSLSTWAIQLAKTILPDNPNNTCVVKP